MGVRIVVIVIMIIRMGAGRGMWSRGGDLDMRAGTAFLSSRSRLLVETGRMGMGLDITLGMLLRGFD